MYKFFATGIGSMIAMMIMFNSQFAKQAGYLLSTLIIHLVGLILISLILVFRDEKKSTSVPFYLYLAGVIGVFVVFSNNYCFQMMGASLTLAIGIIGQSSGSIITDSTGFLGMTKYPFDPKKIFAIVVSLFGIVLMIEDWQLDVIIAILSFFTGILVLLTMVLNTQLAVRIGIFKGTRVNYLAGLVTTCILMLIFNAEISGSLDVLASINPVYVFGGGILGVFTVSSINLVLPKIPTLYSTLLIVIGQMATGLIVDYFLFDMFSFRKLLGVLIVLAGIFINLVIDQKTPKGVPKEIALSKKTV